MAHQRVLAMAAWAGLAWLVACGDSSGDAGGVGDGSSAQCSELNWRSATADAITCPGAPSCRCPAAQVCCVDLEPGQESNQSEGSCSDLAQCAAIAMACDGPEECDAATVCCFRGAGARCLAPSECFGVDTAVLCRQDADCPAGVNAVCGPATDGSYYDGVVGYCQ